MNCDVTDGCLCVHKRDREGEGARDTFCICISQEKVFDVKYICAYVYIYVYLASM